MRSRHQHVQNPSAVRHGLSIRPLVALVATVLPLVASAADAPAPAQGPWLDRSLSADQRATAAVKAMTQEEKLRWVFGYFGTAFPPKKSTPPEGALPYSAGYVPGAPRLGLPALTETDAGLGVATQNGPSPRERTSLPSGLATASTWNPQVAYAGGVMIGAEARESGFNTMLAGGVNLVRDPRNGRNFEYPGEDPLLAGVMVGNTVKGIESNKIISTVKHYAVNAQETGRFVVDSRINKAAMRMSDLLAFQIALEQSDAGSIMCSYNRVNGDYACENDYLLNEVLKRDWGFKGFVMSDWGATHSTVKAANNGLDQESGQEFDKSPYFGGALQEAVENGAVSQARLDDMAMRIVRTMYAKGVVDNPVSETKIDLDQHGLVSRADAEEGIVLLKNDGKTLPLSKDVRTIAIIGGHADVGVLSGSGSSQVYGVGGKAVKGLKPDFWPGPVVYHPSSPLRAIQAQAPNAKVVYDDGTDPARAAQVAKQADVALVFATQWIGEANDAVSMALPDNQDNLIASVAGANAHTVVVLENGGPVAMPWLAQTPAVVEAWYPGTSGGEAIARVLFGAVNPSGHLPVTFPASESQLPRPKLDGDRQHEEVRFAVDYNIEGAAVGYKWFDLKGHKPLFAFGHGLSYTTFASSNLGAGVKDGRLHVRFKVTNTGSTAGKAVPQVYVAPLAAKWEAPKRLGAWDKVELQPGQSKEVDVAVEPRVLGMFDEKTKTWHIAKGKYKVTLADDAAGTNATSVTVDLPATTLDVRGRPVAKK